ncbi:hypothetical protein C8J56DRAFT_1005041 [Mycena floridula]|nr:hypothetical protein C8J56DRAFT_1005041 [Mycena floridula]
MSSAVAAILLFLSLHHVLADPATLSFNDCFDSTANVSQKMSISSVYAQIQEDAQNDMILRLSVLGNSPTNIVGFAPDSTRLFRCAHSIISATLFLSTSVNSTALCSPLFPPSPLPSIDPTIGNYCPIVQGPFAMSASIPWTKSRALTTQTTRLRAVDPFSQELLCFEVETTPLNPSSGSPYGKAQIIFWCTVGLTIAYWLLVGLARISSAWNRGNTRPGSGIWSRAQSAGFILASAISGERLGTSPALLRFCTPSMRDIMFHTQWCAVLGMVAVQWPRFVYPLLTRTAWAALVYNVTLIPDAANHHWNPLSTVPFTPPSNFADQLSDPSSALYLNPSTPNLLFTLPENVSSGMASFAYTLGVRPQDLFGICLAVFFGVIAATIMISSAETGPKASNRIGARSPAFASRDMLDATALTSPGGPDENKSLRSRAETPCLAGPSRKNWWKMRSDNSSFHRSVLHGNLVRILVLFHLPVTVFSVYQMTLGRTVASLSSIILAAFCFVFLGIVIPAFLVIRVHLTTTNKLYDETRTLLALGPVMFACLFFAMNLVFGITIGAGQKSGTAQAIIILVVEVGSALVTSVWLPWGIGASMGLISFLFCVGRIVVAVLLVILAPAINIGDGAAGWVACGVLLILGLVYLALVLMLLVKLIEIVVRIVGGVSFDRSRHVVDSGLLGTLGMVGCCGRRNRHRHHKGASKSRPDKRRYESEVSSFAPPTVFSAANTTKGSNRGSMHSGPPPSVLKPEHALRPYREDSDDESGFIMGAWQPFSARSPGYSPVAESLPSPPPKQTSGFSRVGGGRAHIDTPYAIKPGSTQAFPSIGHQAQASSGTSTVGSSRLRADSDFGETSPVSLSSNAAARQTSHETLPPGAMMPFHIRTRSQTAIIEDAGPPPPPTPSATSAGPPSAFHSRAGTMDDLSQNRKKPWYHIRRHRPHSADGPRTASAGDAEAALDGPLSSDSTPRSFVVVRKQASSSPARSQYPSSASATPTRAAFTRHSTGDPTA